MTRFRPAWWARSTGRTVVTACSFALVATVVTAAPAAAAPAVTESSVTSYVALGDSYAAGPLIPVQTGRPIGCLRSDHNYPSLVARTLDVTDFRDVSCSGATTENLAGAQPVPLGINTPQFDRLADGTDLVTLTIGGNDIGFGSIISECARRSPTRPFGAACKAFFTAGGVDQLAARIDGTAPKVADALAEIERRSPDARVLVVGYPAILPATGPGCFPVIPFTPGDVAYLRDTTLRLNAMLADQAAGAGADYVDAYTATIGHDICQLPGIKWIEGLAPTSPAAPVHPNALGMAGIAAAVIAELAEQVVLASGP